jgi:hypothetical protein
MGYVIWPDGPAGEVVEAAYRELRQAQEKFAPFKNGHEGHSVIREEFDEFWEAVRAGDIDHAKREAIQVAAMAMRFVIDVQGSSTGPDGEAKK